MDNSRNRAGIRVGLVAAGATVAVVLVVQLLRPAEQSPPVTDPTTSVPATNTTTVGEPSTTEGTSDPVSCGDTLPVFVADLPNTDPFLYDGSSGPGPNSLPAESGQIVAHWLADYGDLIYEVRWPVAAPADLEWVDEAASHPATAPEPSGTNRVGRYVQISEDVTCGVLLVEAYGLNPDPLPDFIYEISGALRDRTQLPDYLADLEAATTPASPDGTRPAGQCAEPVLVTGGREDPPPVKATLELVDRFLADRLVGNRATDCLTVSGKNSYMEGSMPEMCLFDCPDGAVLVDYQTTAEPAYVSWNPTTYVETLLEYQSEDGSTHRVREEFEIHTVSNEGKNRLLISNVNSFPESYVDETEARATIESFLTALAREEYEKAISYLFNEGISPSVEERVPGIDRRDPNEALGEFCRTALCGAPFEILEPAGSTLFGRNFTVRFSSSDGPVEAVIGVSMFEGRLTVAHLPPDGTPGDPLE